MTVIANGETGLSVRTKINEAILKVDARRESRSDLVTWWGANSASVASGSILSDGTVEYVVIPVGHALYGTDPISDLPGLMPFGKETPYHWGFVVGSVDAATRAANRTAMQSCVDLANSMTLNAGVHEITGQVRWDDQGTSGVQIARLVGAGPTSTVIKQYDNTATTLRVEDSDTTSQYKFRHYMVGFAIEYPDLAANVGTGGVGIKLRECNAGVIAGVVIDSPDQHLVCERVVQSRFENIFFRTVYRAAGNRSDSHFVFDHNPVLGGRSFGNTVADCEAQPAGVVGGVTKTFDIRSIDTLEVNGGHYNGAQYHLYFAPDGTGGRDKIADVTTNNVYWDVNSATVDLISTLYFAPATTGNISVYGIRVNEGKARAGEGMSANFLSFSKAAATDYDGYDEFWEFSFNGIDLTGFDGIAIDFSQNAAIDEKLKIRGVTISGNKFRDAGSGHTAANPNALVLAGKAINVFGNEYIGNWTDAGNNVIYISDDADGVNVHGEVFDTPRTATNVSVSGSATNWRSYGHVSTTYSGQTGFVSEVVDEGYSGGARHTVWADGRASVEKTVSYPGTAITTAWGGVYNSASQAIGAWPITFAAAPEVIVGGRGVTGAAWVMQFSDATATNGPSVQFLRGTSATIDCEATVFARGEVA